MKTSTLTLSGRAAGKLRAGPLLVSLLAIPGCPVDERTLAVGSDGAGKGGANVVGGGGGDDPRGGASAEGGHGDAGGDDAGGNAGAAGAGPGKGGQGESLGGSGATAGSGGEPECRGTRCSCFGDSGSECRDENCCRTSNTPAGSFTLGGTAGVAASVEGFGLDKYEVTVGRFRKYVDEYAGPPPANAGQHPFVVGSGWRAAWDTFLPADADALRGALGCHASQATWTDAPGENETRPINCVTWFEAFAFCSWDGGRLPTEAEWEYAASGADEAREYPWGNDAPNVECALYDCGGQPLSGCSAGDLSVVGSRPTGAGRFLQLDLAGSVSEWLLDWHAPYVDPCNNCANVGSGSERVTRGGSFLNTRDTDLTSTERAPEAPRKRFPAVGFRCARD